MNGQKKPRGKKTASAPARRMPVWAAFGLTAACLCAVTGLGSWLTAGRGAMYLIGCGAGAMGHVIWAWAAGGGEDREPR